MKYVRQIHLNLNLINLGALAGAWRMPESTPSDYANPKHYVYVAQLAEKAKFDAIFLPDFPALVDKPEYRAFQSMEPSIVLGSIAAATSSIGLIGTISASFNEPYNIARRFATLDAISGGRAGINIVTSADSASSRNFGHAEPLEHGLRYERADEFAQVLKALWDSWEDDAFVGEKAAARFLDPAKVNPIAHHGKHFRVEGALTIGRSPQGRPVIVQAGGSEHGREFAARHADAVFSVAHSLDSARAYADDLGARARRWGRGGDDIRVFPGLVTIIGGTAKEAQERRRVLWELTPIDYSLARLAAILGVSPEALDLDKPLPSGLSLPVDGMQTFFNAALELAKDGELTVRELLRAQGGSTGHRIIVGTPEQVADNIETWFRSGTICGFNIMPDVIPSGLEAFVEHVVPILRKNGVFRSEYSGNTLREHLGLKHAEIGLHA